MVTTPTRVIHFYDTHQRRILCGAGIEHRSTKHARGITCTACVSLLGARREASSDAERREAATAAQASGASA